MILLKAIGIFLMLIGVFILTIFPAKQYQRPEMTSTGIWLGVIIFLIGIVLVVFG